VSEPGVERIGSELLNCDQTGASTGHERGYTSPGLQIKTVQKRDNIQSAWSGQAAAVTKAPLTGPVDTIQ
jgi:hypothetical protein